MEIEAIDPRLNARIEPRSVRREKEANVSVKILLIGPRGSSCKGGVRTDGGDMDDLKK